MNTIATFRLCTLIDDELVKTIDALTDKMFTEGNVPSRYIPARPNEDYDLLLGELLFRFKAHKANQQKEKPHERTDTTHRT